MTKEEYNNLSAGDTVVYDPDSSIFRLVDGVPRGTLVKVEGIDKKRKSTYGPMKAHKWIYVTFNAEHSGWWSHRCFRVYGTGPAYDD